MGWVQAGQGSREEDQRLPGLALLCPLLQSYPRLPVLVQGSTGAAAGLGVGAGRTIPAPSQPGSHHGDSTGC